MKQKIQNKGSRREFVKDGARMVLFGGIALMGGILSRRIMTHPNQSSVCPIYNPCQGCLKLSDCLEPKAAEFKRKQSGLSSQSDSGSIGKPGIRSLG
jgi:hypothetical protein